MTTIIAMETERVPESLEAITVDEEKALRAYEEHEKSVKEVLAEADAVTRDTEPETTFIGRVGSALYALGSCLTAGITGAKRVALVTALCVASSVLTYRVVSKHGFLHEEDTDAAAMVEPDYSTKIGQIYQKVDEEVEDEDLDSARSALRLARHVAEEFGIDRTVYEVDTAKKVCNYSFDILDSSFSFDREHQKAKDAFYLAQNMAKSVGAKIGPDCQVSIVPAVEVYDMRLDLL